MALLWDWNWFRPYVEAQLSASIGRPLTMERLEVHLGRVTHITAHGVHIANPAGFIPPDGAEPVDFVVISRLGVDFAVETWWRTGVIALPLVEADQPVVTMLQTLDGQNNWTLAPPPIPAGAPAVTIGDIAVIGGTARVLALRAGADMAFTMATATDSGAKTLTLDGNGSYAKLPITLHAVGGGILALRDAGTPYPIDANLANGPTRITLKGTIRAPLALTGADLDLVLAGPDMSLLTPLILIPIPKTPPYQLAGKLDFGSGRIKFSGIKGKVGSSDLSGDVEVDPKPARPVLTGTLASRRVDLEDLAGFIGSQPGRTTTPGQTAQQVEAVRRAEASSQLLPNAPIDIPRLRGADVHIDYRGDRIIGKNLPFDALSARIDLVDGHIRLNPLRIGLGGGTVTGLVDLSPGADTMATDLDVKIENVDIARVLKAAGLGSGQGVIDGTIKLTGTGNSIAAIVGHGNGDVRVGMARGGNVNALLVDLSGLQFGRAVLSALGIPNKEAIRCLIADATLRQGVLATRTLILDTTAHLITGGARADLGREVLEMHLRTDPKHFTIGSLSTPILISGPFKNLSVSPELGELGLRGGASAGLGFLFPPAALLPTIQFGVGENTLCATRAR